MQDVDTCDMWWEDYPLLTSYILVPNIIATLLYIDFVYYKNILRH